MTNWSNVYRGFSVPDAHVDSRDPDAPGASPGASTALPVPAGVPAESSTRASVSTRNSIATSRPVTSWSATSSIGLYAERMRSAASELGTPSTRTSCWKRSGRTPWNHVCQVASASSAREVERGLTPDVFREVVVGGSGRHGLSFFHRHVHSCGELEGRPVASPLGFAGRWSGEPQRGSAAPWPERRARGGTYHRARVRSTAGVTCAARDDTRASACLRAALRADRTGP